MPFTLATWNINSVRLREEIVAKLALGRQRREVLICGGDDPYVRFHGL